MIKLMFQPQKGKSQDLMRIEADEVTLKMLSNVIVESDCTTPYRMDKVRARHRVKDFIAGQYEKFLFLFDTHLHRDGFVEYQADANEYNDIMNDMQSSDFRVMISEIAKYKSHEFTVNIATAGATS